MSIEMRKCIITIFVLIVTALTVKAQKENYYKEKIVGTWTGRDDSKLKLIFKQDGTASKLRGGKLLANYFSYEIVRTSEACGHTIFYDDIYILKLSEKTSTSPTDYRIENVGSILYVCSYINGIEDEVMSLSSTKKGGPPLVLLRQNQPTPNQN